MEKELAVKYYNHLTDTFSKEIPFSVAVDEFIDMLSLEIPEDLDFILVFSIDYESTYCKNNGVALIDDEYNFMDNLLELKKLYDGFNDKVLFTFNLMQSSRPSQQLDAYGYRELDVNLLKDTMIEVHNEEDMYAANLSVVPEKDKGLLRFSHVLANIPQDKNKFILEEIKEELEYEEDQIVRPIIGGLKLGGYDKRYNSVRRLIDDHTVGDSAELEVIPSQQVIEDTYNAFKEVWLDMFNYNVEDRPMEIFNLLKSIHTYTMEILKIFYFAITSVIRRALDLRRPMYTASRTMDEFTLNGVNYAIIKYEGTD